MNSIATQTKSLQEQLQDRMNAVLKENFISLIPEEQFAVLTASLLDEFLHGPRRLRFRQRQEYVGRDKPGADQNGYRHWEEPDPDSKYDATRDPNTLPGMVMAELVKLGKERVAAAVNEGPLKTEWDAQLQQMVAPAINQCVQDNAGRFIAALLGGFVTSMTQVALHQFQQNTQGMPRY